MPGKKTHDKERMTRLNEDQDAGLVEIAAELGLAPAVVIRLMVAFAISNRKKFVERVKV